MLVDDYPTIEFSSVDELCKLIHEKTEDWDTRWYRGSKQPAYPLLPKLFRDPLLAQREGYLSVEFRRRAKSKFDWLCAMQHFAIPTRLLDWSESLAVALYFTTRPIGIDLVAPTIWVLNPFKLNALSRSDAEVIPISTSIEVTANADIAFDDDETRKLQKHRTNIPIPVAPDFIFGRLAAQNGAFTLHGKKPGPLENLIPHDKRNMLLKFVCKKSRVSAVYDCIDLIRPSSDAIFPDLEGLKEYIL